MRNSTAPRTTKEASTNVVYKFTCQEGRCDGSTSYIGRTSTTLRRRLQSHRNQGSIFQHYTDHHNMKPPLQKLIDNTSIVHKEVAFRRLQIAEAVSITTQRPTINVQQAAEFTLPSARPQEQHGLHPTSQEQHPPHRSHQPRILPNQNSRPTTRATARHVRASSQMPGSSPSPTNQSESSTQSQQPIRTQHPDRLSQGLPI